MVVIDTHVLVWWVSGDKSLSTTAAKAINSALKNSSEEIVSSISARAISMLIEKGRLILSMDVDSWLDEISQIDGVPFMPVDNEIAVKS